jgi:enoyl-CoA hydratase/carnithine racemase
MMSLPEYKNAFRNIHLNREDGVIEMRLHTDEGPLKWGFKDASSVHAQLGEAFYRIGRDPENRVLVLTGTGEEFLTAIDEDDAHEGAWDAAFWSRMAHEGRDLLMQYLDVGLPVIAAVNGPATFHAELPTMADIVIAADTASFADPHFTGMDTVPGDGAHIWWPLLLGPNRGRAFLLTGEAISAEQALALGVVAEVVPKGSELARARQIAASLAGKKALILRNTRAVLTQDIRRRLLNDLQYGFGLEGLAAMS